jgi:pyruvate,orthophosphate dikinase
LSNLIFNFNSKDFKNSRNLLGGKGLNLAIMSRLGLSVPPGFTITTEVCDLFHKNKKKLPRSILKKILHELKNIEKLTSKKFGDLKNPLLVSVRSGARISMPGMMDTILNLGLNDKTVRALAKKTSNGRFAKDSYRRFIQMYGNVVLNIDGHMFEGMIDNQKLNKGVLLDTELEEGDWDELIKKFKELIEKQTKKKFPQDVHVQCFYLGTVNVQKPTEN